MPPIISCHPTVVGNYFLQQRAMQSTHHLCSHMDVCVVVPNSLPMIRCHHRLAHGWFQINHWTHFHSLEWLEDRLPAPTCHLFYCRILEMTSVALLLLLLLLCQARDTPYILKLDVITTSGQRIMFLNCKT